MSIQEERRQLCAACEDSHRNDLCTASIIMTAIGFVFGLVIGAIFL
jgi:hypothetical protein